MGSYYQPRSYFKGGKRKNTTRKGGFYPSVMGGVVQYGKLAVPLALRQGYKLFNNKKTRKHKKKTLRKKK